MTGATLPNGKHITYVLDGLLADRELVVLGRERQPDGAVVQLESTEQNDLLSAAAWSRRDLDDLVYYATPAGIAENHRILERGLSRASDSWVSPSRDIWVE